MLRWSTPRIERVALLKTSDKALLWLLFIGVALIIVSLGLKTRAHHEAKSVSVSSPKVEAPRASPPRVEIGRAGNPRLYPPAETPGAVDGRITPENIHQTICVSGYTRTLRPGRNITDAIKRKRMEELSLPGESSDYELDHLIPMELGGCGDCPANLWMEPFSDALQKDRVENYLHQQVCQDRIGLSEAQRLIVEDWYGIYLKIRESPSDRTARRAE